MIISYSFDRCIKIWLIFTFMLVVILSLPMFFSRGIGVMDDTNFLIIAKWIKYGFKPYNDLAELKPPAIYYTLYLLNKFFGEAWWVSRIFIFIVDIVSALLFVFFIRKRYNGIIAWLGGINLYVTLMLFGGYRIHTETFCALLGMIGLFIIIDTKKYSFKNSLLFGIIIGLASLYKQPGIFYLIAYVLFIVLKRFNKKTLFEVILAICGFFLVWIITIYLLYRYSMLENFIKYVFYVPFVFPGDPKYFAGLFLFLKTPIPLLIIFLILTLIRKESFRLILSDFESLMGIVIIFSYIPILKRPSEHYYICLLFALIILCSKLWFSIIGSYLSRIKNTLRIRSYFLKQFYIYLFLILPSIHLIGGILYGSIFFIQEKRLRYDCLVAYELGKIVHAYTSEDDKILCFSPYYAGSRFYYILERPPLYSYCCMTPMAKEIKERFEEIINTIKDAKVPVIIMEDTIEEDGFTEIPKEKFIDALLVNYKKIDIFLDKDYSRRTKIDVFVLKSLQPRQTVFRSRIFPNSCAN